jgi:P22 coat protein - gene protein 5
VANVDGGGNVLAPTAGTWLSANATLTANSAPNMNRNTVLNPFTMAKSVASLAGLLNPMPRISEQYEDAIIRGGLNFMWYEDQTVINHTGGSFSAGTVNGAGQTGLTLITNAITGTLNIGDIITIAGVNMVNRITKQDTGQLQQFVVTAAAANGATSLSLYPAIVPPATLPNGTTTQVQYQTVLAAPANAAAISLVNPASTTYRKNLAYVPEAVVLVTADLELPEGVANAARERYDDLSMRMISAYDIRDDVFFTRLDILYGFLWIRPEWCIAVADNTSAQ